MSNNQKLQLHEVFTISGVPKYNFVKPEEYPRLLMALKTPGRGISVEGPSGIGKTTAITKAMEEVGITEKVVKLSARKPDDVPLIKELPKMQPLGTVIIDDFHKLPDGEKKQIADLMKVLADEGRADSKVVAIGINRAGEGSRRWSSIVAIREGRSKRWSSLLMWAEFAKFKFYAANCHGRRLLASSPTSEITSRPIATIHFLKIIVHRLDLREPDFVNFSGGELLVEC